MNNMSQLQMDRQRWKVAVICHTVLGPNTIYCSSLKMVTTQSQLYMWHVRMLCFFRVVVWMETTLSTTQPPWAASHCTPCLMFSRSRWMELLPMDLDTKVTAVQRSPLHKLCKCQLQRPKWAHHTTWTLAYLTQLWFNVIMWSQVLIMWVFFFSACLPNQHQRGAGGWGDMWKLSLWISREHIWARPQPRDEPRWRQRQPGEAIPSSWSCAFSLTVRSKFSNTRPPHFTACVTLYSKRFQKQQLHLRNQTLLFLGNFFLLLLLFYLSAFLIFLFLIQLLILSVQ